MSQLESLMRDVARAVQSDARRRQLVPEIQARLVALEEKRRPARAAWRWSMGSLAVGCAAAIGLFVWRAQPLSFAVDGASAAGAVGAVGQKLAAPESAALSLRFSDGSQVTLPPRAQAHVDDLDNQGATVAVDEGTVEVSVVHRAKTRWQVRAGRYQIHVTGTRFAAGWDSRAQTLTVTMREGSVIVTGPGLKQGTPLTTGQRLRVKAAVADAEPAAAIEDATAPEVAERTVGNGVNQDKDSQAEADDAADLEPAVTVTEAAVPATGRDERRVLRTRRAAPAKLARLDNDWREFEGRHQYKEALAAALRADWDVLCQRLGADDLVRLGNTARFARDYGHAESAYQAAHRRFPKADQPIYFLGWTADARKNYAAAAGWYENYLKHFPRGQLAELAAGRLLESRLNAGDNAGARDAAASYLRNFPHGPHASKARATVSQ
jgi:transmembrane sensor